MTDLEAAKAVVDKLVQTYNSKQKEIQTIANEILKAQGVYEYELKKASPQPELSLDKNDTK